MTTTMERPDQLELPLTEREADQLRRCEAVIVAGLEVFYRVGNALLTIRDGGLYRATHHSFEGYCMARFGMKRSSAYRWIDAAQVVNNLLEDSRENLPEDSREAMIEDPSGRGGEKVSPIGDTFGPSVAGPATGVAGPAIALPANEAQARPMAALPPEAQREVWRAVTSGPEPVTAARVQGAVDDWKRTNAPLLDVPEGGDLLSFAEPGPPALPTPPVFGAGPSTLFGDDPAKPAAPERFATLELTTPEAERLPRLSDLPKAFLLNLSMLPEGCTADCPCRRRVAGDLGAVREACADMGRYNGLRKAEEARAAFAHAAFFSPRLGAFTAALDALGPLPDAWRPVLALLATRLAAEVPHECFVQAVERQRANLDAAFLREPGEIVPAVEKAAVWLRQPGSVSASVVAEALVRAEIAVATIGEPDTPVLSLLLSFMAPDYREPDRQAPFLLRAEDLPWLEDDESEDEEDETAEETEGVEGAGAPASEFAPSQEFARGQRVETRRDGGGFEAWNAGTVLSTEGRDDQPWVRVVPDMMPASSAKWHPAGDVRPVVIVDDETLKRYASCNACGTLGGRDSRVERPIVHGGEMYAVTASGHSAFVSDRRQAFEQSKAYNQGMVQTLEHEYIEYSRTKDPEARQAIASVVLHDYADYDQSRLPPDLYDFVQRLKDGDLKGGDPKGNDKP